MISITDQTSQTRKMRETEAFLGVDLGDHIRDLYHGQGLTLKETASVLAVSDCQCLDFMRRLSIPRRTRAEATARSRQDPEKRGRWLAGIHRFHQSPEGNAAVRLRMQNPVTRTKLSLASKNYWQKPESKVKAIKELQRRWSDPQYRANMLPVLFGLRTMIDTEKRLVRLRETNRGDEFRGKMAVIQRIIWQNQALRDKVRRAKCLFWSDPSRRDQMSSLARSWWANDEYRARQLLARIRRGGAMNRFYTPALLRFMMYWKGKTCSYPGCETLLTSERTMWNACPYHSIRIDRTLKRAERVRKRTLSVFGFEPI